MANQVVWVDVPVTDLKRATAFYSAVLGAPLETQEFGGMAFALFPTRGEDVGGCIFERAGESPSETGPLIYFNADQRLDEAIAAVEPHGGRIIKSRHPIGPHGHRAIVVDSEGNRIALHST